MTQFPLLEVWRNAQQSFPKLKDFDWSYDYNSESYYLAGPTNLQGSFCTQEKALKYDYTPGFGIASEDGRTIHLNGGDLGNFIEEFLKLNENGNA